MKSAPGYGQAKNEMPLRNLVFNLNREFKYKFKSPNCKSAQNPHK